MAESNGRKAGRRFNVIDVLVILVIAAACAAAVWLFAGSGLFGGSDTVPIEFELQVVDIKTEIASHIKAGVDVIEANSHYNIGKLEEGFSIQPYVIENYKDEYRDENGILKSGGEMVSSEKPGYVTVMLPIAADAVRGEDGYYVNGFRITVGTLVYFRMPDFCGSGYIVNISENGGETSGN